MLLLRFANVDGNAVTTISQLQIFTVLEGLKLKETEDLLMHFAIWLR